MGERTLPGSAATTGKRLLLILRPGDLTAEADSCGRWSRHESGHSRLISAHAGRRLTPVHPAAPLPLSDRRVEALGEPVVDWREEIAGFGTATLIAVEPGEAHGGAQFPELGPLLLGNTQGFVI